MDDTVTPATPPEPANTPPARRDALRRAEFADQLRSILRWSFLAIAAIVICAAAAFVGASLQRPYYGARSEIALYANDSADLPEQYLTTQILTIRSQAILGPVSADLKIPVKNLEEGLSVDFPEGGALMRVEYVHQDSATALRILDAIVNRYAIQLQQVEMRQRISHEILVRPFILEDPVRPRPVQAAAIGGAAGLALVIMAFVLVSAHTMRGGRA